MSEMLASLPSLPPHVQGDIHGVLHFQVGAVQWTPPDQEPAYVRIKFWGEEGPGVFVKPGLNDSVSYSIKCVPPVFANYLSDMTSLDLDVVDEQWRLIGKAAINLNLYMSSAASRRQELLEVDGLFPVLIDGKKAGEIEVKAKTEFLQTYHHRTEQEVLESFQLNELRARIDAGSPTKVDLQLEGKAIEAAERLNPKKVFVPKRALKKIPKPELPAEEVNQLQAKAEDLKKKMMETIEEYPQETPTPAVLTAEDYTPPTDLQEVVLQVRSVEILAKTKEIKGKHLELECTVPIPAKQATHADTMKVGVKSVKGNLHYFDHESSHRVNNSQQLAKVSVKFRLLLAEARGKVTELGRAQVKLGPVLQKGNVEQVLDLVLPGARTSAKPVGKLSVCVRVGGQKPVLETTKLSEQVLQSPVEELGVTVKSNPVNEEPPKPSQNQALVEETKEVKEVKQATPRKEISSPEPVWKQPAPTHLLRSEDQSFQLYLFIESGTQFLGSIEPNLFLSYKGFPKPELISTPVYWKYKEGAPIHHTMLFPVTASSRMIERLSRNALVIEVWNKVDSSSDELLGLVKLPLFVFGDALTGDMRGLLSSMYPLIAVDEYRAITNLKTGKDVGYLRVCLAMGSAMQVHRLQSTHRAATIVPVSSKPGTKPVSPKVKSKQVMTDTLGSVTEIATLLNTKQIDFQSSPEHLEEGTPEQLGEGTPEQLGEGTPEQLGTLEEPLARVIELREELAETPRKTFEEIAMEVKAKLEQARIDLEEELRLVDRGNRCWISKTSLSHLLSEMRVGLDPATLTLFLNNFPEEITFASLLESLGIAVTPSNIKYTFNIEVSELSCQYLAAFPNKTVFLKYLFPQESRYIESELLEYRQITPVKLQCSHSFSVTRNKSIADTFQSEPHGIQFFLCQEDIIARGLFPIEELVNMKHTEVQHRVVCLYGDRRQTGRGIGSDLLAKIKISIGFKAVPTFEETGQHTKLVYQAHTEVQRVLPKQVNFTVGVGHVTDLLKASKHCGGQVDQVFVKVHCFDEELRTDILPFDDTLAFNYRRQASLVLNEGVLETMRSGQAVAEVVGLSLTNEEFALGTAQISLVPLLLNSAISGEFALLNEYGQYMGCLTMVFSFLNDLVDPPKLEASPVKESVQLQQLPVHSPVQSPARSPVQSPARSPVRPSAHGHSSPIKEEPEESTPVQLTIEAGLHLSLPSDSEVLVSFEWFDKRHYETVPVRTSRSHLVWNSTFSLDLPVRILRERQPLVLCIVKHDSSTGGTIIGGCIVDISTLCNLPYIDGWYQIVHSGKDEGQLKVRVYPRQNIYELVTGKPRPAVQGLTTVVEQPRVHFERAEYFTAYNQPKHVSPLRNKTRESYEFRTAHHFTESYQPREEVKTELKQEIHREEVTKVQRTEQTVVRQQVRTEVKAEEKKEFAFSPAAQRFAKDPKLSRIVSIFHTKA